MEKEKIDNNKRTARQESSNVEGLAQPLQLKTTWDDLKLPANEKQILREITDQIKTHKPVQNEVELHKHINRKPGTILLFTGNCGTGKTMAAEVIAKELKLPMYRIDLSAVVSKYIGETEKNLRRLFDAAEDGGVILFFDEADALFGKRSEVKDSHDRYANFEISYLLQRMESYRGLIILTTDTKEFIDKAFLRRISYVVEFPVP